MYSTRPRVARGGILVLGGGVAGSHFARVLGSGGATIVNSLDFGLHGCLCPHAEVLEGTAAGLDAERRLVFVDMAAGTVAVAYAELIVATGKPRLPFDLALPRDVHGRVLVNEKLRVVGAVHVWALGACAAVPNPFARGGTDPATRRHARRQARALAENLRGTPRPYRYLTTSRKDGT